MIFCSLTSQEQEPNATLSCEDPKDVHWWEKNLCWKYGNHTCFKPRSREWWLEHKCWNYVCEDPTKMDYGGRIVWW